MNRPVKFVLHGGEKALSGGGGAIIVDGGGVDVGDFLIKLSLAEADLADTLELFLEILLGQDSAA